MDRALRAAVCLTALLFHGCAVTGSVTDRGGFETKVARLRLENGSRVKVHHGGATRMIPLRLINTITIDPLTTVSIENGLFFGADITLKDGTSLQSFDKDATDLTKTFISVQDAVIGKNDRDRIFIRLHDVSRITIW